MPSRLPMLLIRKLPTSPRLHMLCLRTSYKSSPYIHLACVFPLYHPFRIVLLPAHAVSLTCAAYMFSTYMLHLYMPCLRASYLHVLHLPHLACAHFPHMCSAYIILLTFTLPICTPLTSSHLHRPVHIISSVSCCLYNLLTCALLMHTCLHAPYLCTPAYTHPAYMHPAYIISLTCAPPVSSCLHHAAHICSP